MTEEEWLSSNDLNEMFQLVWSPSKGRQVRLFFCGTSRVLWPYLVEASKTAVETAERDAEGLATLDELDHAHYWAEEPTWTYTTALQKSAAEIAFAACGALHDFAHTRSISHLLRTHMTAAPNGGCKLFCDIFGNPFRPITFLPEWRTDTALSLAQTIYESRDFSAMPILADALQDAGCDNDEILNHCRGPGPHIRGCWAVDLVLGKE